MKTKIPHHISDNLKSIRQMRELTQKQLADRCGLTHSAISMIENGQRDPKLSTFMKVVEGLGAPYGDIFDGIQHGYSPFTKGAQ